MKSNSALPQIAVIVVITTFALMVLQQFPELKNEQPSFIEPTTTEESSAGTTKEFTFYDVLKEGEVIVTKSNYTSTPKAANLTYPTLLQIAATSSKDSALALTRRLKDADLETVHVVERDTDKGVLYLIRTTPYKTYDTLKAGIAVAEKLNFHPDKVLIK